MNINEIQDKIIGEFSPLDDLFEKYKYLVSLGKVLEPLGKEYRVGENSISGCQSEVWLRAELKNKKIYITADSDALITKGILALLLRVVNNQSPKDILSADFYFIDRIGLSSNLSPARWNGVNAILKRIRFFAENF